MTVSSIHDRCKISAMLMGCRKSDAGIVAAFRIKNTTPRPVSNHINGSDGKSDPKLPNWTSVLKGISATHNKKRSLILRIPKPSMSTPPGKARGIGERTKAAKIPDAKIRAKNPQSKGCCLVVAPSLLSICSNQRLCRYQKVRSLGGWIERLRV